MSFGLRRALVCATSAFSLADGAGAGNLAGNRGPGAAPGAATGRRRPAAQPSSPVASANSKLDEARDALSPRFGASSFDLNRAAIESLPQGINTPIQKVLIQAPGVSQDSAAAGDIHVRNEHGNVQYRINGITLPDGVSGFGHVFDTNIVGSLAVITGALPAQFGLRTAGVVDIQTKSGNALVPGGEIGIYGGSHDTVTPTFEYQGRSGQHGVFSRRAGLHQQSRHRKSDTERGGDPRPHLSRQFLQLHLDTDRQFHPRGDDFRQHDQPLPDPEQSGAAFRVPAFTSAFGVSAFNSANLNEKQAEQNNFAVVALQRSINGFDFQLASFTRYSTLHFIPDTTGDICSTDWRATSTAKASPAASRATAPIGSATRTPCAPALP